MESVCQYESSHIAFITTKTLLIWPTLSACILTLSLNSLVVNMSEPLSSYRLLVCQYGYLCELSYCLHYRSLFANMIPPMRLGNSVSSHIAFITAVFLPIWIVLWTVMLSSLPQSLFANMNRPMSLQIVFIIEPFSTHITFVRFLSGMYSLMSFHLVSGWKSFWTETASKWSSLLVDHSICNKRNHS